MGKSAAGHLRVRTDKAAAELDMDFLGSGWKPDWRLRWTLAGVGSGIA